MNCPHHILIVDSFHVAGTFVHCMGCGGSMYVDNKEGKNKIPFVHTSDQGADHDIYLLIDKGDVT